MKNNRIPLAILSAVFLAPFGAVEAVPVMASIDSCTPTSCLLSPNGGPVSVDPAGFTLEVDFSPEHVELIEPNDDRGEWLLQLSFTFTGAWNGTEHFGDIDLTEMGGVVIPPASLNVGFDDTSGSAGNVILANYEIFGPDTLSTFFVHGFNLGLSDVAADPQGFVRSVEWTGAKFTVRQGGIDRGLWVPEPATMLLLPLGLASFAAGRRRRDSAAAG